MIPRRIRNHDENFGQVPGPRREPPWTTPHTEWDPDGPTEGTRSKDPSRAQGARRGLGSSAVGPDSVPYPRCRAREWTTGIDQNHQATHAQVTDVVVYLRVPLLGSVVVHLPVHHVRLGVTLCSVRVLNGAVGKIACVKPPELAQALHRTGRRDGSRSCKRRGFCLWGRGVCQ